MRKNVVSIGVMFTSLIIICGICSAHDLWININDAKDNRISVAMVFGHNFPFYDIFVPKDKFADLFYITPSGEQREIENIREEKDAEGKGALVGDIPLNQPGIYVIYASIKRKGSEKQVPSEKYAKAVISYRTVEERSIPASPHNPRLDIVPLVNPGTVKVGECVPVMVMYEGKPLSTYLYATYAGYYSESEPFPVIAKSDENGKSCIPIDRKGKWLVQCSHKVDISATLTFSINQ